MDKHSDFDPDKTVPEESTNGNQAADAGQPEGNSHFATISDSGDADGSVHPGEAPQIDGYQITGKLGEGGMGTVWRAVQLGTRREVALKLLGSGVFGSDKARMRFEREVELAARLEHSNIARVYESGLHRNVHYYAMELVDGVHLDEYVEANDLSPRQVLELVKIIAQAVQHAHQRGVIHRDLKPTNILVTEDGQPHVLDFGLAKTFLDEDAGVTISMPGEVAGTPGYMAPEQAAGHVDQIDTRTDVYSLGVILYRLLTGRFPHDLSGTRYEVLRRIAEDQVKRPRDVSGKIDKELEALLLKALAHESHDRYASAGDLAADINNYLTGEPLTAKPPTTMYFLRKRIIKHRVPVAIAAAVLTVLAGLAVFAYINITWERNRALTAEGDATQQRDIARKETTRAEFEIYRYGISQADRLSQLEMYSDVREVLSTLEPGVRGWEYGHLMCLSTKVLLTLKEAGGRVAFSPDGKHLAGGSIDKTIKLWDTTTGKELLTFEGHSAPAPSVAFSPDGKRLASGSMDKTIKLWDATTGKELLTFEGHSGGVISVAFSPDGKRLASGGEDDTIQLWDAVSGKDLLTFKGHSGDVYSVVFSPNGKQLASGSFDNTVKLWDTTTGKELLTLKGHSGDVLSIAFSPDGKRLASGSFDETIRLWDTATGKEVLTIKGDSRWVLSVAFSPDGERLASGGLDHTIKLWDTATGEKLRTLKGHSEWVHAVVFSPDGKRLASGSRDKTVKLWDIAKRPLRALKGHSESVQSIAFSSDGKRLASGSFDKTIKLWDTVTGKELLTLTGHLNWVHCIAFSPDGKLIASGSEDKTIKLWDTVTGKELLTLKGHSHAVSSVAFSPDCKRLASTSYGTTKLWDIVAGKELLMSKGLEGGGGSVAFSPDGKLLASVNHDNSIKLCNAVTGRELLTLKGHSRWLSWSTEHSRSVASVAFSCNGKLLASGSEDKTIGLWDTVTGEELLTLKGHSDGVTSVAFSPDDKRLVSGSRDGTIKLWDTVVGKDLLTLTGHSGLTGNVAFSPNGKQLASGSMGNTIMLWDTVDWTESSDQLDRETRAKR
ncbi:MAG: protein kinase [Phycisphaerae bacterium]|jgi:WD40 repeat protein|nr:protein kinase [Phycisphaerae bacterium]